MKAQINLEEMILSVGNGKWTATIVAFSYRKCKERLLFTDAMKPKQNQSLSLKFFFFFVNKNWLNKL